MLTPKPDGCKGCPLYGNGAGFVRDKVVAGARTTICLSTPSTDEVWRGASGYGGTWLTVQERYLPLLGVTADDVNITHSVRCARMRRRKDGTMQVIPFTGEDKETHLLTKAAYHCQQYDTNPGDLIIAMGQVAFNKGAALHDEVKGQHSWRGHLLP